MELHSLTCPKCGSSLEVEDGLDTFFCKYCGEKIQLSGMSDAAYRARIREKELSLRRDLRQKELDQDLKLRSRELDLEQKRIKLERRNSRRQFIVKLLHNDVVSGLLGMFLILFVVTLLVKLGVLK